MELEKSIEHLKDALKIEYGENVLVNRECLKTVLDELDKAYAEIKRLKLEVAYHIQQPNNIQFFK